MIVIPIVLGSLAFLLVYASIAASVGRVFYYKVVHRCVHGYHPKVGLYTGRYKCTRAHKVTSTFFAMGWIFTLPAIVLGHLCSGFGTHGEELYWQWENRAARKDLKEQQKILKHENHDLHERIDSLEKELGIG